MSRYYTRINIPDLTIFSNHNTRLPHVLTRLPYINCYRSALSFKHSYFYPLSRMAPLGLKNIFSGPSKEPQHNTAGRLVSNQDGYMGPGSFPGGLPPDQGREPPTSHVRSSFRTQKNHI